MLNINNFSLDQNTKNSLESLNKLKEFIEKLILTEEFKTLTLKLFEITNINKEKIEIKLKRLLLNQFIYEKNKFSNFNSIFTIIGEIIIFFVLFCKTFFFKKIKNEKNSEVILTNVDCIDEIEKFKKVLVQFNNSTIITKEKINFSEVTRFTQDKYLRENLIIDYTNNELKLSYKNKKEIYKFNTKVICEKDIILSKDTIKNRYKLFTTGLQLFLKSIEKKFNFLKFLNIILYSYFKNFSIFNEHKAKYLLQDRVYYTCPIKNYFFKKFGGKKTACVQSHLTEGTISMFNDIDDFYTFGNENNSISYLNFMGSRISHCEPVGSLRLESFLENNSKNYHLKKNIDVLIIGVNIFSWYYLNYSTRQNYYKSFEYFAELSKKYKNLNFFFKHHPNNNIDKNELKIVKNSNIKYIDKKINSYQLIKNAKLFFSFSSTLILETCGKYGNSFFVDPIGDNGVFFDKNPHLHKIRIVDFKNLENIIKELPNNKFNNNSKFSDACLESDNTSLLISKALRR